MSSRYDMTIHIHGQAKLRVTKKDVHNVSREASSAAFGLVLTTGTSSLSISRRIPGNIARVLGGPRDRSLSLPARR
jgi:hypothetical protein